MSRTLRARACDRAAAAAATVEREGALEARQPVVADAVEDIDGEAIARGRRLEQDLARRPASDDRTDRGGARPNGSSRKRSSHAAGRFGKLAKISSSARLDGGEAVLPCTMSTSGRSRLLAALVLQALEHGARAR